MAAPVIVPELQFSDADGEPYAGGSIATYIPGTSTPKTTWVDPDQLAANTNPVVLDAAGRSLMYGDGEYRLVLRDAAGNLVWDVEATTIVSAAMAPVVAAPTIADAVVLLGIDDLISDEAAARIAADATEATTRAAADTALQANLDAEIATRGSVDVVLQSGIDFLQGEIDALAPTSIKSGQSVTDVSGHVRITFAAAFATACDAFVCTVAGTGLESDTLIASADATGADVYMTQAGSPIAKAGNFYWMATGH